MQKLCWVCWYVNHHYTSFLCIITSSDCNQLILQPRVNRSGSTINLAQQHKHPSNVSIPFSSKHLPLLSRNHTWHMEPVSPSTIASRHVMLTEAQDVSQHLNPKSAACFYFLRSSFPIQPFCCWAAGPAAFSGGPGLCCCTAGMAGNPGRRKASLAGPPALMGDAFELMPATPALMGDAFELLPGLFTLLAPMPVARSVHRACTDTF